MVLLLYCQLQTILRIIFTHKYCRCETNPSKNMKKKVSSARCFLYNRKHLIIPITSCVWEKRLTPSQKDTEMETNWGRGRRRLVWTGLLVNLLVVLITNVVVRAVHYLLFWSKEKKSHVCGRALARATVLKAYLILAAETISAHYWGRKWNVLHYITVRSQPPGCIYGGWGLRAVIQLPVSDIQYIALYVMV